MVAGQYGQDGADVTSHAVMEQNHEHVHVTIQNQSMVAMTV